MNDVATRLRESLRNRYTIEHEIGAGGMATVYQAHDLRHRRRVAIKVLRPDIASALGAERFLQEIETSANLRHPHILPLFDSGDADGSLFYVMPLVTGETLRQRLMREKQLPVEEALQIARECAGALGYAHTRGVIHRDIKPDNILLESGHAVIADFGIARVVSGAGGVTLTQAGTSLGTPQYMSPEQIAGELDLDGRSDQYSLACVLYEMLAGQPPFTGQTIERLYYQQLMETPPTITRFRSPLPSTVTGALRQALAKSRTERFATVTEFAEALRSAGVPNVDTAIPCVAVLPLLNMSPDAENEYFADGITEDVIAQLSKVRGLRVISRTSVMQFKKREQSLRQIGATLNATVVLDGSVRRAQNRVRVVAQLIDVATEGNLWSETYDRELTDIFAIQSDVALQIATALQTELTRHERRLIEKEPTRNFEAYELFMRARQSFLHYTADGMRSAVRLLSDAIAQDPEYALAYARQAQAYTELGESGWERPGDAYRAAKSAANKALALDSDVSEVQCLAGYVKFVVDFDWNGAEAAFKRALELSPSNADAYALYGRMCGSLGRHETAILLQRRAHELDPVAYRADLPAALLRGGQVDEAQRVAQAQVNADPNYFWGYATLAWTFIKQGNHAEGIRHLQTAIRLDPDNTLWLGQLGQAYGISGDTDKAREVLARLEERARTKFVSPYHFAYVLTGMGEHERALNYLEEAYDSRSGAIYGVKGSFLFTDLHPHPRFQALLRKMNLA